jgi:hypothetical protein
LVVQSVFIGVSSFIFVIVCARINYKKEAPFFNYVCEKCGLGLEVGQVIPNTWVIHNFFDQVFSQTAININLRELFNSNELPSNKEIDLTWWKDYVVRDFGN